MAIPDAAQAAAAIARRSQGSAQGTAQTATPPAADRAVRHKGCEQFAGQVGFHLPGQSEGEHSRSGEVRCSSVRSEALECVVPTRLSQHEQERWVQLVRMHATFQVDENAGILKRIADHKAFENLTIVIITINALWIGVDLELNTAASWPEAHPVFKVADNFFCVYFSAEVMIRVCACRPWVHCFFEKELLFDSVLVVLMVLETWVLPLINAMMTQGSVSAQMSQASIFRLLRLLRLTRMIRLMRAFPELVVLIKGMIAALRSVATNFLFLLAGLWVFGIIFLQTYKDVPENTDVEYLIALRDWYFSSLGTSMVTLFVQGTLLDDLADLAHTLKDDSWFNLTVFFVFVLISSLTLLNMLIGVLAEVVATTAEKEGDDQAVLDMIKTLKDVFNVADINNDEHISADEFERLCDDHDSPTVKALKGIGIDPVHLDSLYQQLFEDEDLDIEIIEYVCPCGNCLMSDATFCRKCGKRRTDTQEEKGSASPSRKAINRHFPTKELGFVEFMDGLLKLKPSIVSVADVMALRQTSVCASQEVMGGLLGVQDRLRELGAAVRDLQDRLPAAFAAPVDGTVGVPAAGPVEGAADQHIYAHLPNSARGTCSWAPSATEGTPIEPASPAARGRTELPSLTIQSTSGASEYMHGAKSDKSSPSSHASPRQVQKRPVSPISPHSVRWPPAPVEPLARLPSLGGPGSSSSTSISSLALPSPRSNSGQKCESKLSTVPTEMIIEEMARRMLKGIDLY